MSNYKMVPIQPTDEMIDVGDYARSCGCSSSGIYADMLAAAPDMQGELVAWATRMYNTAYHAGHHDTVEGGYTHVYHQDMDSYHEDIVQEWMEDNPYPAGQHPDAQGESVVSAGWAADAIRDAHLEGQRSATGRHYSLFRWNNSESHAVFLRLLSGSQPAEQQPAPDVSALVEALSALRGCIMETRGPDAHSALILADAALATYRNQKDNNQ